MSIAYLAVMLNTHYLIRTGGTLVVDFGTDCHRIAQILEPIAVAAADVRFGAATFTGRIEVYRGPDVEPDAFVCSYELAMGDIVPFSTVVSRSGFEIPAGAITAVDERDIAAQLPFFVWEPDPTYISKSGKYRRERSSQPHGGLRYYRTIMTGQVVGYAAQSW